MRTAALVVLVAASLYLVVLGIVALVRPAAARAFLARFAQTLTANTIESLCRLAVGAAFLIVAHDLPLPTLFAALGWVLIVSSIAMLALPGLHKRFADRAVPAARSLTWLVGVVALVGGAALAAIVLPLF